jgi:uroporphyrinogen-III synthase
LFMVRPATSFFDIILTRPAAEALSWATGLRKAGHRVKSWPLIEVNPMTDVMRLRAALDAWHGFQAVMFVSRAAVNNALGTMKPKAGWGMTRCWATGPGTRQALRDVGVPDSLIDSPPPDAVQFDTETLWTVVQHRLHPTRPVLLLRGSDGDQEDPHSQGAGRDWLLRQLAMSGVAVEILSVYQRTVPHWDKNRLQEAREAAHNGSVWLFSSSQALENLASLLPEQDWSFTRALATHARIAQTAKNMGMGQVFFCRPNVNEVLASLESLA